jgi:hypothetical protein
MVGHGPNDERGAIHDRNLTNHNAQEQLQIVEYRAVTVTCPMVAVVRT